MCSSGTMMGMYRVALYTSCALALLLYVLNRIALTYHLFWRLWWYDIPMHLVGGMVLGAGFVWFFGSLQERKPLRSDFLTIVSILGAVFIGGVVWEVYEYVFDLNYNPLLDYVVDTVKDMSMDMLGAVATLWFYKKRRASVVHGHG